jgi:hypothetical protein
MKMKVKFKVLVILMTCFLFSGIMHAQDNLKIYGYGSLYFEKVGPMNNQNDSKGDPGEFSYTHFNIMMQKNITDKIKFYINLAGPNSVEVRNYWGEYAFNDRLKLRVGKIYAPFDQFNELLDAAPTYLGMEPPEIYDKDHLMLPRTGKIMLHGGVPISTAFLKYAYMMNSDEQMLVTDGNVSTLSHNWDIKINLFNDNLTIGHSGYLGNERNGTSVPLGSGSPDGGVLPWMKYDKYNVLAAYTTAKIGNFSLQAGYSVANHDAVRDTGSVVTLYQNTVLNESQLHNFFGSNPSGTYSGTDVVQTAKFKISSFYVRLGYTIPKEKAPFQLAEISPYAFFERYSNPETIAKKTWGGDNEAGITDDGVFFKPTLGVVIKPTYEMAFKIDASSHIQKIGGETVNYKEIRFELSYMF